MNEYPYTLYMYWAFANYCNCVVPIKYLCLYSKYKLIINHKSKNYLFIK